MNNLEKKIFDLLEPVAENIGMEIVKVTLSGSSRKILEILVDKIEIDSSVTISDCRNASNNFSAILDVEDMVDGKYYLEVSSAGIERPLVKISDYEKFKNREAKINLLKAIEEKKKYKGEIQGTEGDIILLKISEEEILKIDFADIRSAHLIFTEEMFKKSLSKK